MLSVANTMPLTENTSLYYNDSYHLTRTFGQGALLAENECFVPCETMA